MFKSYYQMFMAMMAVAARSERPSLAGGMWPPGPVLYSSEGWRRKRVTGFIQYPSGHEVAASGVITKVGLFHPVYYVDAGVTVSAPVRGKQTRRVKVQYDTKGKMFTIDKQ